MTENKLTDRTLRNIRPSDKEQTLGDGGGLWVRVQPAAKGGAINFYYRFELHGKEHRISCGSYPETTLAQARKRRNQARDDVRDGINPAHKQEVQRSQAAAAIAVKRAEKTVNELFEDWQKVYLSTHHKDGGAFAKAGYDYDVRDVIGNLKARDIQLAHVVQVVDRILNRGSRRKANQILSLMRQMFRHGLARGLVDMDPTLGLSKKQVGGKETPVSRNLSLDEIKDLGKKLPESGLPLRMQAGLLLILATGVRVGELLNAEWEHFDLRRRTWLIPAEHSKNGREHIIHLSKFSLRQIQVIGGFRSGPFLFCGQKEGTPLSDKSLSKAVRDRIRSVPLKKRTPNTGALLLSGGEWSPHDLRRTMASRMGDLGVAPHIIERCLNHIQPGITGVYQRQEYVNERRDAYNLWGKKLEKLASIKTAEP